MKSKAILFFTLLLLFTSCTISGTPLNPSSTTGYLVVYDSVQNLYFLQNIATGKTKSIPGFDSNDIWRVGTTPDSKWLFIRLKQSDTHYLVSLDNNSTIAFTEDGATKLVQWINKNKLIQWKDPITPINVLDPFSSESQVIKSEYPYILSEPLLWSEFSKWEIFLIFDPSLQRVIYVGDILKIPSGAGLLWLADVATGQILSNIDAKLVAENPPVWSPNAQSFVVVDGKDYVNANPVFNLYLFDRDGRKVSQLTHYETEYLVENINWSPNSRFIAFLRELSILSVKDIQNNKLVSEIDIGPVPNHANRFIWLPNGWQLVFQKSDEKGSTLILFDLCKNSLSNIKNSDNLLPVGWIYAGNDNGNKEQCDSSNK